MQAFGDTRIEIGMVVAGALGLLILLAPAFGRKPKQTAEGWQFPVKLTCLLVYWLAFAAGIGVVAYAGRRLLALGAANGAGWACFAFGFALVLFVLADWPEPLISDREGIFRRGSASSRIRWRELSYVRQYQIRYDHGLVMHSIYGKQLVVNDMAYNSTQVRDWLMEHHPAPVHSLQDEWAPISIFRL